MGSSARTLYRADVGMTLVVPLILTAVIVIVVVYYPSLGSFLLLLQGGGTCLWYAHVALFGVSASVSDGALVIKNPLRVHVVPLLAVKGFTMKGSITLYIATADGGDIEIAAASPLQRADPHEVRKRAQILIAMVERAESRMGGAVTTRIRRGSVVWLSVTVASMLIGFGWYSS